MQLNPDTKKKKKLNSILRTAEKGHYSKLISDAKGNIKYTWTFLMQICTEKEHY